MNPLVKAIDERIQVYQFRAEKGELQSFGAAQALEELKQLAIAEAKHQEDWRARFVELRKKHESIMQAERDRIVKELEEASTIKAYHDVVYLSKAKAIVKGVG